MSHSAYPNRFPVHAVVQRLRDATRDRTHAFWPDDISLLDHSKFDSSRIMARVRSPISICPRSQLITEEVVTFDRAIATDAIIGVDKARFLKL